MFFPLAQKARLESGGSADGEQVAARTKVEDLKVHRLTSVLFSSHAQRTFQLQTRLSARNCHLPATICSSFSGAAQNAKAGQPLHRLIGSEKQGSLRPLYFCIVIAIARRFSCVLQNLS